MPAPVDAGAPPHDVVVKPMNESQEVDATEAKAGGIVQQSDGLTHDGPTLYRCLQGFIFAKRDENPQCQRIAKVKWPLSKFVKTTGTTWRGPAGGVWAELDVQAGEFGWALISGPGFGLSGPALVDVNADGESSFLHVKIHHLAPPVAGEVTETPKDVFETLIDKQATVAALIKRFATAHGLKAKLCMLAKALPAKMPNGSGAMLPADYIATKDVMLEDRTLASYNFSQQEVELYLVYASY
eukprot:gnl/TRDRNA2_/TRDRNA2_188825_c0_seq1.p1 gnl/TRDRNA2_/TRDRNA2_188825_c0~~gnl/TRDRNA2_/TRDRNA2_188825_c0_seq1.p1  ORF type:complete len:255 (-),score=62.42 gnl/TRDRNA2_/TRDRNA2_188825_c0_seq1:103-825(-)